MEDRDLIVKQLRHEFPKLDHLLCESMVIAYEQGKLEEIMSKIDTDPKHATYTELIGNVTIENKNVPSIETDDGEGRSIETFVH